MITLKDFTLRDYIEDSLKNSTAYTVERENAEMLLENHIFDCEKLDQEVSSGNPEFQRQRFLRILTLAKRNLAKIESGKKKTPPLYTFDRYDNHPKLKRVLEKADTETFCSALPIFTPIDTRPRQIKDRFYGVSVASAKWHLNSLRITDGRNAIVDFCPGTHPDIERVVRGINMYEDQLFRTIDATEKAEYYRGNIFYKDRDEKERRVRAIIEDIILYMTSDEDREFVFGSIRGAHLTFLKNCLSTHAADTQKSTLNNLVTLIRDYVTLEELEEGIIESGVIKRFVAEPKK